MPQSRHCVNGIAIFVRLLGDECDTDVQEVRIYLPAVHAVVLEPLPASAIPACDEAGKLDYSCQGLWQYHRNTSSGW